MTDVAGPDGIVATDVSVRYGERVALQPTSLTIEAGSIHGIIGPAGGGKTSFLRTLNLMSVELDGAHADGSIRIGADEILADARVRNDPASLSQLRRRVGIVFATPQPLPRSIFENVVYGPRVAGVSDRPTLDGIAERALRAAHMWDEVSDRLSLMATRLSGGQQQRLCLARTLATNPRVVLLDEPCSGLDPISTARIEETLRTLKSSITFVLVTNSIYQAERVADHTSFFLMGERIETAATADLFARPTRPETRDYLDGRFG